MGQGIFLYVQVIDISANYDFLGQVEQLLVGEREADATAAIAAVAERMYRTELPHGVFHIEQCLSLQNIQEALRFPLKVTTKIT